MYIYQYMQKHMIAALTCWYWQCIWCRVRKDLVISAQEGGADSEIRGRQIHFCERCSGIFRKASEKDQWLYKKRYQASPRISSQVFLQKSGIRRFLIR